MSMIMRIARGTAPELERLAESHGDASVPPAFTNLLNSRRDVLANLPPEIRARLDAVLQAQPQLAGITPQVMERLRRGFRVVPPSGEAGDGDDEGQAPGAATPRPEIIDIHKSWHVFHFLFTGQAAEGGTPPASLLLEGGREVGEDMGYGPSRLLEPSDTAAFAQFVGTLTVAGLKRRIDAPRMASLGIYCAGDGSRADAEEMADDVDLYFPRLQAHFRAASQAGQATLIWLA